MIDDAAADYCTLWPDGSYGECCRLHDLAYADPIIGKAVADWHLMTCVAQDGGWPMAITMLAGVTLCGLPFWLRARRAKRAPIRSSNSMGASDI